MSKSFWYIIFLFILISCVEEFDLDNGIQDSRSLFVVESTITNEIKKQQVMLSRAIPIQTDSVINFDSEVRYVPSVRFDTVIPSFVDYEQNAVVSIEDDSGNVFLFSEESPGIYVSDLAFAAESNKNYLLNVVRSSGESYRSNAVSILGQSQIDDVYAERIVSANGDEGMAIFVNSSDPTNEGKYFRYTYEETYKIIAPNWTPFEFEILNDGSIVGDVPAVKLVPRAKEEQVCYNTVNSSDIKLANTVNFGASTSQRNLIRFVKSNNPIISHRYSILVKQLAISEADFNYYQILDSFSSSESFFSEVQPGFIEGNINAVNSDTNVIGYFSVAAVDEKRIFFNYEDYFPGESLPPYFSDINCDRVLSPILGDPERDGPPPPPNVQCAEGLIEQLITERVEYLEDNSNPPDVCEGPYRVTFRICGDCTVLGSNKVPEFWVE
jgi:hypothetical protein